MGEDFVHITTDKLSVEDITQKVTSPSAGAISVFMGTTRDNFDGKTVIRLEYECYTQMAEKEMKKLCQQIREKWSVKNIAFVHRIGVVPVTEASVIIAVSSAHRREALEAVQYGIDTLKSTVPIWKKEVYADGSTNWKENKECSWSAESSTVKSNQSV
ncbi:molybdopterin synthase catalytic subunit-like [Ptychodera flava]|uniref:molybdopterin synthase catalytic subunit-like n=1 Tax=Ptychodera flava TaxID=63121 RepID=UPI00396A4EDC